MSPAASMVIPIRAGNEGEDVKRQVVPSRIPSTSPYHEPWELTAEERQVYREMSRRSREAKRAAMVGEGPTPVHPVNVPRLDVSTLMPTRDSTGLRALSLFSGGGGLDIAFWRAGFEHVGSYEILEAAAATLAKAHPEWTVYGGSNGDVQLVDWNQYRGAVDLLHGGPPCQPFSNAGRQRGEKDNRNMWPEFVRAVQRIRPAAFVGENVAALASEKFSDYVRDSIIMPLERIGYIIYPILLHAGHFGVPQIRRRVFFVGFRTKKAAARWRPPIGNPERKNGVRWALGLPDIGYDDLSPTIRSTLTGPRHTTSILNSVSARNKFERLQIWPNGVAQTREAASRFVPDNGHFRLSIPDVSLIQGFPDAWPWEGATYMSLGQIGNAVPPPMGYAVAVSVSDALLAR